MENYINFLETYNNENFGLRISVLRNKKGVSARKMSLELGQNKNYINSIESGKNFPTMQGFFEICYYLDISPSKFFEDPASINLLHTEITDLLYQLPPHIFQHFCQLLYDFAENSSLSPYS